MFESKYSKVLTVILVIVIIAIIGLLGFLCNGQDATIKIEQNTENRTTIGDFSWQLE